MEMLYVEPRSPWGNGHCENFNRKLRDECLNAEIVCSRRESQAVIKRWRTHYNTKRPHSAFSYRPPAAAAYSPSLHRTLSTQLSAQAFCS